MRRSRLASSSLVVLALLATPTLTACGGSSSAAVTASVEAAISLQEGLTAQVAGRTAAAKKAYGKVLEKDPGNKIALYNLGIIAQKSGDLTTAEARYRAALASDTAYAPAIYNLASVLSNQGGSERQAEAIKLYRKVLAADPKNADAHLKLAFLLLETGNRAAAQAEFKTAVQLNPTLASRINPDQSPVGNGPGSGGTPSPSR